MIEIKESSKIFDLSEGIPTEQDFLEVITLCEDIIADKDHRSFEQIALDVSKINNYKAVRWLIASILCHFTDLKTAIYDVCISNLGFDKEDIKKFVEVAVANKGQLEAILGQFKAQLDKIQANQEKLQNRQLRTTNGALKQKIDPNTFYRITAYDITSGGVKAARPIVIGSKLPSGIYDIRIHSAEGLDPLDQPTFDSQAQAQSFIDNLKKANTKRDISAYIFNITQKVTRSTQCMLNGYRILINTVCGPAYINEKNKYCIESLEEDIEKHDTLNPVLFENNKLIPEVREKLLEIAKLFTDGLDQNEIKYKLADIKLVGSNASYNYTKDSDIDLHLVFDTKDFNCPDNLYPTLYDICKTNFNDKYDFDIKGIPVELYAETEESQEIEESAREPLKSNGIYSVLNDEWIKEPVIENIPKLDKFAFDKELANWEQQCIELIDSCKELTEEIEDAKLDEIDDFLDKLYEYRANGLKTSGEYGVENSVFKELRNKGYIDKLKALKIKLINKDLSLEEDLSNEQLYDYKTLLSQISYNQAIVQPNGLFNIYQVKDSDLNRILAQLRNLKEIEWVNESPSAYDFSNQTKITRKHTIYGKLRSNVDEAYKNKTTGQTGEIVKDLWDDYVLFQDDDGNKSTIIRSDLEEIPDAEKTNLALNIYWTDSFKTEFDELKQKRPEETNYFYKKESDKVGALQRLAINGLKSKEIKISVESIANNKNTLGIHTVYALIKGIGSHNQFRPYFYVENGAAIFVHCLIKKQTENTATEYTAIKKTANYEETADNKMHLITF